MISVSKKAMVLLLLFSLVASGCTSMQAIPMTTASNLSSRIHPGDKIIIVKTSGEQVSMKVSVVSNTGITGNGQTIAFSDMTEVQVREIDGEKTELLTKVSGGIIAGYFALRELAKAAQALPAYSR